MVNPWHKYKNSSPKKKQALHSLFVGLVIFFVFYVVSTYIKIPLCPIKNILDVPCFGCGLTRGFIAIFHFNMKSAIHFHVLSIPIFCCLSIYSILCISDILLNRNDLENLSNFFKRKYMFILYIIILIISSYINSLI